MKDGKKAIKVKFTGFWKEFDEKDNFILKILNPYFDIVQSDEPEYLFYSVFNDDFIKYDCVRIFITGENVCPDFQMCDYAIGFERMNFGDRYLRCPFYFFVETYQDDLAAARRKHLDWEKALNEKEEFCSFVYSNEDSDEMRTRLFKVLDSYKKVNAGGKIFNSYNGKRVDSKRAFERKHKFSIACENSAHSGYTTEKLLQAFAAGTVPIYWGNPDVGEDFNKEAFIDVRDFADLKALTDHVKEVDQKEELLQTYLQAPAFCRDADPEEYQRKAEEFLLHICEQPVEQAFRRNRVLWGRMYQRRYWVYKRAYGFVLRLKKILGKRFIEKIEGNQYE